MKRTLLLVGCALTGLLLFGSTATAAPMISSYDGYYDPSTGNFTFTVNFAGPVSPASAHNANSVYGFLDLDTDQNAATGGSKSFPNNPIPGGNNWINSNIKAGRIPGPTIATGDEFFLNIGSEQLHPGSVNLTRTSDNVTVATDPITFGPNSFTIVVPRSQLGSGERINFDILVGTVNAPSDRAPKGADPATTNVLPEPSSLALFGLVGAAALVYGRRRRQAPTPAAPADAGP
jgi:hypothetical protein